MSYKTEFQSNNADLQAILDAVNNLPTVCASIATEIGTATFNSSATVGWTNLTSQNTSHFTFDCTYANGDILVGNGVNVIGMIANSAAEVKLIGCGSDGYSMTLASGSTFKVFRKN